MITNAASYKFFRCTCCLQRYGAIIAGSKFPNYKPNEIKNPGKRSLAALANRYYPDLKMDKSYFAYATYVHENTIAHFQDKP